MGYLAIVLMGIKVMVLRSSYNPTTQLVQGGGSTGSIGLLIVFIVPLKQQEHGNSHNHNR